MTAVSVMKERIRACGVIPVLIIEHVDHAVPITEALLAGGIDVVEITLRTDCALDAMATIKASGVDCLIGAGTITTEDDITACAEAGAEFLVTPATPAALIDPLKAFSGLVVPGAATPTEALTLHGHGFDHVKFFPAGAAGGANMLKSLGSPLPNIRFMPTGGVSLDNLPDYLHLPNVVAAGGSWLCSKDDIAEKNWKAITQKALAASELVKKIRGA